MPGDLDHGALRGEVAAQDREAAIGLERVVGGPHDGAVRASAASRTFSARVRPLTVSASPSSRPADEQLAQDRPARRRPGPGRSSRTGRMAASRRSAAGRRGHLVEVVQSSARPRPRARSRAGAARRWWSRPIAITTATAFRNAVLVRICRGRRSCASAWTTAAPDAAGQVGARGRDRGRRGLARQRHAERLGAGRPSCWPCTCRRTSRRWDTRRARPSAARLVRHGAGRVRADGLEHVLDRDRLARRAQPGRIVPPYRKIDGMFEPRAGHQHAPAATCRTRRSSPARRTARRAPSARPSRR